jgi:Popeye protein conserved region
VKVAMQNLIHLANVLYLVSFLVSDILWLRLLNVLAGGILIAWLAAGAAPAAPIAWNSLFLAINVVQVWRLLLERRPVRLRAEELTLYQLAFRSLTLREFARLAAIGRWEDAGPGDHLVEQGVRLDRMLVLCSGTSDVVLRGECVAQLRPGQLVGEMGFLTDAETSAAVVAAEPTRYLALPTASLRALFKKHPELRAAMQMVIGHDLVAKLRPGAGRASA